MRNRAKSFIAVLAFIGLLQYQSIPQDTSGVQSLLISAEALKKQGQYQQAIYQYQRILALDAHNLAASLGLSDVYYLENELGMFLDSLKGVWRTLDDSTSKKEINKLIKLYINWGYYKEAAFWLGKLSDYDESGEYKAEILEYQNSIKQIEKVFMQIRSGSYQYLLENKAAYTLVALVDYLLPDNSAALFELGNVQNVRDFIMYGLGVVESWQRISTDLFCIKGFKAHDGIRRVIVIFNIKTGKGIIAYRDAEYLYIFSRERENIEMKDFKNILDQWNEALDKQWGTKYGYAPIKKIMTIYDQDSQLK